MAVLDSQRVRRDLKTLLDNPQCWNDFAQAYSNIDALHQVDAEVYKIAQPKNVDKLDLLISSKLIQHFFQIIVLKISDISEIIGEIKKFEHDNSAKFAEFLSKMYGDISAILQTSYENSSELNHNDASIFNGFRIDLCHKTVTQVDNKKRNLDFVLLQIGKKHYQCTVKDIRLLTDLMHDVIKEVEN